MRGYSDLVMLDSFQTVVVQLAQTSSSLSEELR